MGALTKQVPPRPRRFPVNGGIPWRTGHRYLLQDKDIATTRTSGPATATRRADNAARSHGPNIDGAALTSTCARSSAPQDTRGRATSAPHPRVVTRSGTARACTTPDGSLRCAGFHGTGRFTALRRHARHPTVRGGALVYAERERSGPRAVAYQEGGGRRKWLGRLPSRAGCARCAGGRRPPRGGDSQARRVGMEPDCRAGHRAARDTARRCVPGPGDDLEGSGCGCAKMGVWQGFSNPARS